VALGVGYTIKARDSSVYIRHEGEKEEREFPPDATTKIHPGDVVRVPQRHFGQQQLLRDGSLQS